MARPALNVTKVTVTLNKKELFEAQLTAAKRGVKPEIVLNNSAFIRYLIKTYRAREFK